MRADRPLRHRSPPTPRHRPDKGHPTGGPSARRRSPAARTDPGRGRVPSAWPPAAAGRQPSSPRARRCRAPKPMCSMLRGHVGMTTRSGPQSPRGEVFTVRTYATGRDYEPRPSAQIRRPQPTNQQLKALQLSRSGSSDKSQVLANQQPRLDLLPENSIRPRSAARPSCDYPQLTSGRAAAPQTELLCGSAVASDHLVEVGESALQDTREVQSQWLLKPRQVQQRDGTGGHVHSAGCPRI
jgi:hypothetical protein